jgi:PqqD family protein of HPr-rel-A system
MHTYARSGSILIESMGHLWAAFSPASGETILLNDETAAILEGLEGAPAGTDAVCALLSRDSGIAASELKELVETAWPKLLEAGLVRQALAGPNPLP